MFKPLDCDDDVLLFDKDAFTVGRFKELTIQYFGGKLRTSFQLDNSYCVISDIFSKISICNVECQATDIRLNSNNKEGKILRIGSKGWQKGKIRVHITFDYSSKQNDVYLEFCPDEPTEAESPLDDLRQLPEYKQQS